jgi:hypothetical protein
VEERGPRATGWSLYMCDGEAHQDGEGGGRRRWQGAPDAIAGDGAACKRQGETIAKGHKNYDLMLYLQLGIR